MPESQRTTLSTSELIAQKNDQCRQSLPHVHCYITRGLQALLDDQLGELLKTVRDFSDFTPANDPYGERDFGSFVFKGKKCFWKIDAFADSKLIFGASTPLSPETVRVITLMLADEY